MPFSDSPSNTDRNTVTDGPAAELGVQLFRLTGDATYLQFAAMAYEWVRRCLLQPSGLYADHIRLHGVIDPALWSYNQGSMIGAGVLLYQATGNGGYLYQARQTAKAALAYFTVERLLSENPFFPAVYFRNLMYLDSVTHDPPGPKLAQTYVDSVWVAPALERRPVRVRLAAVLTAADPGGGRADLRAAVHAGEHILLMAQPVVLGVHRPARSASMLLVHRVLGASE